MNAHNFESREPLVSVIILNFNGQELLHDCLISVLNTCYPNYEVIVVDNASTDRSCEMVEREFPHVKLVRNQINCGYSKGNNIGILRSIGDFVVLLNNDTVVTPNWLYELVHEAKQNPDCFYQPKILFFENNRINSTGNCIQFFGFAFPRGMGVIDVGQYDSKCEVSYASGACVLASRKLVETVGLLDEGFFTFYEDVNWGWRALMLGYTSIYVPSAVIYHRWGGSWGSDMSSKKFFLIERSRLASVFRNYSTNTLIGLIPLLILIELSVLFYSFTNGFLKEKILVYSDLIRCKNILISQRKKLQRIRKKSDSDISCYFTTELNHPYLGKFSISANKMLHALCGLFRLVIR